MEGEYSIDIDRPREAVFAFLKEAPVGTPEYERSYALIAAHYEAKKMYKDHCATINTVLEQSRYKYNPNWNLESAKCLLRNHDYNGAVEAAGRTISGQMDLPSSSKTKRVLLAYKIKASARTAIYEADAKKNAGFGEIRFLDQAISAWKEVENYAGSVGVAKDADKAKREIEDLEQRRPPE